MTEKYIKGQSKYEYYSDFVLNDITDTLGNIKDMLIGLPVRLPNLQFLECTPDC